MLQKARIILFIGVWVAVLPALRFPFLIKNILYILTGLILIYISLLIYKKYKNENLTHKKQFDNFSENFDFEEIKEEKIEEINNSDSEEVEMFLSDNSNNNENKEEIFNNTQQNNIENNLNYIETISTEESNLEIPTTNQEDIAPVVKKRIVRIKKIKINS